MPILVPHTNYTVEGLDADTVKALAHLWYKSPVLTFDRHAAIEASRATGRSPATFEGRDIVAVLYAMGATCVAKT